MDNLLYIISVAFILIGCIGYMVIKDKEEEVARLKNYITKLKKMTDGQEEIIIEYAVIYSRMVSETKLFDKWPIDNKVKWIKYAEKKVGKSWEEILKGDINGKTIYFKNLF